MNRRKVLMAIVMAPFTGLMGKVTPKPIKTEADLTEAIDRGMVEGLARPIAHGTGLWGVTWTPEDVNKPDFGVTMRIAGYNNPDSDIVSLRFNGDGK